MRASPDPGSSAPLESGSCRAASSGSATDAPRTARTSHSSEPARVPPATSPSPALRCPPIDPGLAAVAVRHGPSFHEKVLPPRPVVRNMKATLRFFLRFRMLNGLVAPNPLCPCQALACGHALSPSRSCLDVSQASSLDRPYSAYSVVWVCPSLCRPGLPLAGLRLMHAHHLPGFPGCYARPLRCMLAPLPPARTTRCISRLSPRSVVGIPLFSGGSAPAQSFLRPARCSRAFPPAWSLNSSTQSFVTGELQSTQFPPRRSRSAAINRQRSSLGGIRTH